MKAPILPAVVYFDGVCNLCNGFVDFLIRRDRFRRLRYAPQQGASFAALRARHPELPVPMGNAPGAESLVTVVTENGVETIYRASEAVRVAISRLPGIWKWFGIMFLAPRFLREGIYRQIAENRYSVFGRREICRLPTDQERALFLD